MASFSGPMGHFSFKPAPGGRSTPPTQTLAAIAATTPTSPSPTSTPSSSPPSTTPSWRRRPTSSTSSSSPGSSPKNSSQKPWVTGGDWRSAKPLTPSEKAPEVPAFDELKLGEVLFLPGKQLPHDSIFWQHPERGNPQCHPVVVVGKWSDGGEEYVHYRMLTSFGGQRLESSRKPQYWQHYMMCQNQEDQAPGAARVALATLE
ncbi:hypothetical protein BDW02DRAFT_582549 [Decorospora gaudefroyi]|uniref:Uncharacterized protein n=1 Tax=Decorospora gaudefroyi TaxID=184978 RepID=A0A6A5K1K7_9PLEO|nr:hypothetical protein BDW02DRAFT_582549 [Decorospora gaudefroyi]